MSKKENGVCVLDSKIEEERETLLATIQESLSSEVITLIEQVGDFLPQGESHIIKVSNEGACNAN